MSMTPSTTTREAPTMEGGGASNQDSSTSRERDRREHSGERSNPGHSEPRLSRVLRTPIEVGRALQGDSPATNKNGLIAGSKRKRAPKRQLGDQLRTRGQPKPCIRQGRKRAW